MTEHKRQNFPSPSEAERTITTTDINVTKEINIWIIVKRQYLPKKVVLSNISTQCTPTQTELVVWLVNKCLPSALYNNHIFTIHLILDNTGSDNVLLQQQQEEDVF